MQVTAKWISSLVILQLLISNVSTGTRPSNRQLDIPAMKSFFARPHSRPKQAKGRIPEKFLSSDKFKPGYNAHVQVNARDVNKLKLGVEQPGSAGLKGSSAPVFPHAMSDLGLNGALISDIQQGHFQKNPCGIQSVNFWTFNCPRPKTSLSSTKFHSGISVGGAELFARHQPTPFGTPNKNAATPIKSVGSVQESLNSFKTTGFVDDWTPITYVKRSPSISPPLRDVPVPIQQRGVPIKVSTSSFGSQTNSNGHLQNNHHINDHYGKLPFAEVHVGVGEVVGRIKPGQVTFGKPIKLPIESSGSSPPSPSFRNFGHHQTTNLPVASSIPSTPTPATKSNYKTIEEIRSKSTIPQYDSNNMLVNGQSASLKRHNPKPSVVAIDSFNKNFNAFEVNKRKPSHSSNLPDSGINPKTFFPFSFTNQLNDKPNFKDASSFLKVNSGKILPPSNKPSTKSNRYPQKPSLIRSNFNDGHFDSIGTVSSFSYFYSPDWAKEFDEYFNTQAGKKIAKQFNQYMFDHTGFPGNKIRKNAKQEIKEPKDEETRSAGKETWDRNWLRKDIIDVENLNNHSGIPS